MNDSPVEKMQKELERMRKERQAKQEALTEQLTQQARQSWISDRPIAQKALDTIWPGPQFRTPSQDYTEKKVEEGLKDYGPINVSADFTDSVPQSFYDALNKTRKKQTELPPVQQQPLIELAPKQPTLGMGDFRQAERDNAANVKTDLWNTKQQQYQQPQQQARQLPTQTEINRFKSGIAQPIQQPSPRQPQLTSPALRAIRGELDVSGLPVQQKPEAAIMPYQPTLASRLGDFLDDVGQTVKSFSYGAAKGIGADAVNRLVNSAVKNQIKKYQKSGIDTKLMEDAWKDTTAEAAFQEWMGVSPAKKYEPSTTVKAANAIGNIIGNIGQIVAIGNIAAQLGVGESYLSRLIPQLATGAATGAIQAYGEGKGAKEISRSAAQQATFFGAGSALSNVAAPIVDRYLFNLSSRGGAYNTIALGLSNALRSGIFTLGGLAASYPLAGKDKPTVGDMAKQALINSVAGGILGYWGPRKQIKPKDFKTVVKTEDELIREGYKIFDPRAKQWIDPKKTGVRISDGSVYGAYAKYDTKTGTLYIAPGYLTNVSGSIASGSSQATTSAAMPPAIAQQTPQTQPAPVQQRPTMPTPAQVPQQPNAVVPVQATQQPESVTLQPTVEQAIPQQTQQAKTQESAAWRSTNDINQLMGYLSMYQDAIETNPELAKANGWDKEVDDLRIKIYKLKNNIPEDKQFVYRHRAPLLRSEYIPATTEEYNKVKKEYNEIAAKREDAYKKLNTPSGIQQNKLYATQVNTFKKLLPKYDGALNELSRVLKEMQQKLGITEEIPSATVNNANAAPQQAQQQPPAASAKPYRYYFTARPPSLGTQPSGYTNVVAFDNKQYVPDIGKEAWGYVEYDKPVANPDEWDLVAPKKEQAAMPKKPATQKKTTPQQLAEKTAEIEPSAKSGDIVKVSPQEINVDPDRFQFKLNVGAEGTTPLLKDVKTWDKYKAGVITVWQDKNGKTWVVNGHHRLQKAKELGVNDLNAMVLKESDGITDKQARAIGAMINIAEGRGTALDAAKFIRDSGLTKDDLEKEGISLREGVADKGLALAQLSDAVFNKVLHYQMPIEQGVIIGRELPNDTASQKAVLDMISRHKKDITTSVLEEIIKEVKSSTEGKSSSSQLSLFSDESLKKNYVIEKAEILGYIKKQLRTRKNLFKNLSAESKAAMLQEAGNVLNIEQNTEEANMADAALFILDKQAHAKGSPISDFLNDMAAKYADSDNKVSVKREALNGILDRIKSGSFIGGSGYGRQEVFRGTGKGVASNARNKKAAAKEVRQEGVSGLNDHGGEEKGQIGLGISPEYEGRPDTDNAVGIVAAGTRIKVDTSKPFEYARDELEETHKANHTITTDRGKAFKEVLVNMYHEMTRTFKDLPETPQFAKAKMWLLQLQKERNLSVDRTIRILKDITRNLNPNDMNTFERYVELMDYAEDAKQGLPLPNQFTEEDVKRELERIQPYLNDNVKEAFNKRKKYWDTLRNDYIEAMKSIGFDMSGRFTRTDYFRHQVLEYVNMKEAYNVINKNKIATNRSFTQQRTGEGKNINTDYLQAEFEVMSFLIHDTNTAKTYHKMMNEYDMIKSAKENARIHNSSALNKIIQKELSDVALDSHTEAQLKLFNRDIAKAYAMLFDWAKAGKLWLGENGEYAEFVDELARLKEEHDDYVKALREGKILDPSDPDVVEKSLPISEEMFPRIFAYLSDALSHGKPGASIGSFLFRTITEKNEFIQNTLGRDYKTWRDMVPDGYTIYQLKSGNRFYLADSIPQKIADQLLEDTAKEILINASDLRKIIAMGGKYPEYVIPQELASTIDNLFETLPKSEMAKALKEIQNVWKQWVLTGNPTMVVKYNIRNLLGDIDAAFAVDPGIFQYASRSYKELRNSLKNDKFTPELKEWLDRGGYQSLLYTQEVEKIGSIPQFSKYYGKKDYNVVRQYLNMTRDATNLREAVLRYAAYLRAKELLKSGKMRTYWASRKEIVESLPTIEDKAYKLSNDALGAYDEITEMGRMLRQYLMPFYSWLEANFKRYYRIFSNIVSKGNRGNKILMALRVLLPTIVLMVWNMQMFPEEEEQLPDGVRERPHIVLGRDKDGQIIYFSRVGSLSDFLEWFGLDTVASDVKALLVDQTMTLPEYVANIAKSPLNKIAGAISPFYKTPFELITRQSLYPDVTEPSGIRDRMDYLAKQLGVQEEYRNLAGLPVKRPYFTNLSRMLVYKADPEESAYYHILDRKEQFLKKIGESSQRGFYYSEKSIALYNAKLAIRYNDKAAFEKFLLRYIELGGTDKGFKQSIAQMSPAYGLSEEEQKAFFEWLPKQDRVKLKMAIDFYKNTILPDNTIK